MRSKLAILPALAMAAAVCCATTASTHAQVAAQHSAHPRMVTPKITLSIDGSNLQPGKLATLRVEENIKATRTFKVTDTAGVIWKKVADNGTVARFRTRTSAVGGTVTVSMTRIRDQATATARASYDVVALWPGQQLGKVILGMSCGGACAAKESDLGQAFGVHRTYKRWGDWAGVGRDIQHAHAASRLPWVSVKSPGGAKGWTAVAAGEYDTAIGALATTLKANDGQPVILTFHHEPSNDGTEAQGADWAAAYVHFHDVLASCGALANVADVPVLGDWLFNPSNKAQDPSNWITRAVLKRAPFLGVDMYENASGETYATRIPLITDWMAAQGFPGKQVGIGETGSTDYYARWTAVQWMNDSLGWAAANPDQVGVISYFNSTANSRAGVYWPLDESAAKLASYRRWLDDAVTAP